MILPTSIFRSRRTVVSKIDIDISKFIRTSCMYCDCDDRGDGITPFFIYCALIFSINACGSRRVHIKQFLSLSLSVMCGIYV